MAKGQNIDAGIFIDPNADQPDFNGGNGSGDNGGDSGLAGAIDPADAIGSRSGTGDPDSRPGARSGRGRGRPRGPGARNPGKSKADRQTLDIKEFSTLLYSVHQFGAVLTKIPELELDEEEAKKLAQTSAAVLDLYEIKGIPKKYMVWGSFAACLAGIYGTRIAAIQIRLRQQRAEKPVELKVEQPGFTVSS